MDYKCKTPCANCPYRKDAPKALWSIEEFKDLLKNEDSQFGTTYGCHKQNGSVCVGWLMNQVENDLPSIALRISLSTNNVTREYLESLHCKSKMFKTVKQMSVANFPELKNF